MYGVGAIINLGDEDEVDGVMNMKKWFAIQLQKCWGEYLSFWLVGGRDCNVVIYEVCMGKWWT